MTDIYSSKIKQQLMHNIEEVPVLLEQNDGALLHKIGRYARKFDMDENDIYSGIKSGDRFALITFAKNPTKQQIYKRTAANYIKQISGVKSFGRASAAKIKEIINSDAGVKMHAEYPYIDNIDFKFKYEDKTVYVLYKYASNNSNKIKHRHYQTIVSFIEKFRHKLGKDVIFIAIADGPFYQKYDSKAKMKKIDNLKRMCTPKVKVCTIYDLEDTLKSL